jgi:crossover junction endodeoxyribonuclease RuvC
VRILGIDPGTRYTGLGVIDKIGNQLKLVCSETIVTVKEKTLEDKLLLIHQGLSDFIKTYEPKAVAIEKIFHSVNPHSSLILGHARGVAMLTAKMENLEISEFAPNEVKSAVVGVGRATKDQVAAMVRVLLNLDRRKKIREDESDALAIAICCANTMNFRQMALG